MLRSNERVRLRLLSEESHAPQQRRASPALPDKERTAAHTTADASSASEMAADHSLWSNDPLVRQVATLVGSQVMLNLGVAQVVPVLPILGQEMGLGATGLGILISAPSAARLGLNIPLGRLADTVGRKPLMQWGTCCAALGAAGTGLTMPLGLAAVLPFRLLVGAGSASSMTGSSAMMADLTDTAPRHRTTIMGLQSTVLSGAWVVGPIAGGWLADTYGARNAFYLAGLGIGLCSLGYSTLPETLASVRSQRVGGNASRHGAARAPSEPSEGESTATLSSGGQAVASGGAGAKAGGAADGEPASAFATYMDLLRSPNVQALSALATASALGQACFMSVVTLHARHLWDAGAADLGMMFSLMGIAYVVGMPIGGWLGGKLRRKTIIVPGVPRTHKPLLRRAPGEPRHGAPSHAHGSARLPAQSAPRPHTHTPPFTRNRSDPLARRLRSSRPRDTPRAVHDADLCCSPRLCPHAACARRLHSGGLAFATAALPRTTP